MFYWNYDSHYSDCLPEYSEDCFLKDPSRFPATTGAKLLARNEHTDFMLLDLLEDPKWNNKITLHYLGWDRDTNFFISAPAVGIHHFGYGKPPHHYIYSKAVSIANHFIFKEPKEVKYPPDVFAPNTLWRVHFNEGATYLGSSGSPLLNSNKQVIETNFPLSEIGNLKIVNLLGVTVYETQKVTEHIIQLPSSASGLQFVIIYLKDGTVLTQKVIIQR
jgi:hypothetical protein